MTSSNVPLPEHGYLVQLGRLAYTVSYLEWLVLGDLPRLHDQLPADLTLASLEGRETGRIAGRLTTAVIQTEPGPVRDWLEASATALQCAARLRNDVLHARPATHPTEDQRLYRAVIGPDRTPTGERFWIDTDLVNATLAELDTLVDQVLHVRICLP